MQSLTVHFGTGQWQVIVDGAPVLDSTTNKPARQITGQWTGFVKDSITFKRTDSAAARGEAPEDIDRLREQARERDPGSVTPTPGAAPGRPFGDAELDPKAEAKRRTNHQTASERRAEEKAEKERRKAADTE